MPYRDPEKTKERWKAWYSANAKRHAKNAYARRKALAKEFQEWKKTLSCMHCGENEPICLEFHHVDPATKDGDPSSMALYKGWALERLKAYLLETCLVLCANCHRKVHKRLREMGRENPNPGNQPAA